MTDNININRSIGSRIRNKVFRYLNAPYMTREYEELWAKKYKDNLIYKITRPLRKVRDKNFFLKNLREQDIFIIGHPKSGNTWLSYMLAIVLNEDLNNEINLSNIGEYVPVIHGRDSRISEFTNLPDPRAFRSEWAVYPEYYPKTIYIVRDPRAVLVSYFHMYRIYLDDKEKKIEEFIEEYLHDGCIKKWEPLVRWDHQVLSWLSKAEKNPDKIIVIKYEQMVKDLRETLVKLTEFVGLPINNEVLDCAVPRGAFNAMKKNEDKHGAEAYPGEIGKRGKFIRSGKIDGWKDEMPESMQAKIAQEFKIAMKAMEYTVK